MSLEGGPAEPLDALGHLFLEMRRLDLILWAHAKNQDRPIPSLGGPFPMEQGPDPSELLKQHIERTNEAVDLAMEAGARLPLIEMCAHLQVDGPSLGILMLGLAPHVERHYEELYAWLQGNAAFRAPRLDLALQVFGATPTERLALRELVQPGAPLTRSGFMRLLDPPEQPGSYELSRLLWVSPRILRYVTNQPGAEPEVEAVRAPEPLPPPTQSQLSAMARFARVWEPGAQPGAIAVLRSEDPLSALAAVAELAEQKNKPALLVDLSRPLASRYPMERVVEAVLDEARLLDALVAFSGFDELEERQRDTALGAVAAQLTRFEGCCILVAREALDLRHEVGRRPVLVLEAPLPNAAERESLWAGHLGERPDTISRLPDLARAFRLGSGQIRDAARVVTTLDASEAASPEHLRQAAQSQSRHGLGQLAQRVPAWGAWEDLILPAASVGRLRSIVDFLRHRETVFRDWGLGLKVASWGGVTAMFAGPPGTGKTLSASLIAQALGLELFRIDLANVVSKYIGETEKNLDKVFRAAYRSNAVLFFDEADALFGKRTEVKDAHDRYANVETSYLLQKLESFDGLAVLATNLKKNIDAAFMRRIDIQVDFPFPNTASRKALWETLIPKEMPRDAGLDTGFLADRFELSGGNIKNVVQAAALRAAAEGEAVGMKHLLMGVRWEMQKQGKLTPPSLFGEYAGAVAEEDGEEEPLLAARIPLTRRR